MKKKLTGVSLFELLVSIGVVMVLVATMMPVLKKSRDKARSLRTMNNLKLIVIGVSCFANDNHSRYPPSVATIGTDQNWNWQEPTFLTAFKNRSNGFHRSASEYLRPYIEDEKIMFCPNAPRQYKYLRAMWRAGDNWDNPDTPTPHDPAIGSYCFYWNYTGWLPKQQRCFIGPQSASSRRQQSKLLVSDYFGYGHWRNKNIYGHCKAYGSCERFRSSSVTPGTAVSSDFWSLPAKKDKPVLEKLKIELHSGYTDGHVESYSASETVPMKVIKNRATLEPYEYGPGVFYLPANALD